MIVDFLSQTFEDQNGIVGFAPGFLADADDTAVTALVMRQFNMNVSFVGLLTLSPPRKIFERTHTKAHQVSVLTAMY